MTPAQQANALLDQGRVDDALAITAPLADQPQASHALLAAHARALKALERLQEALIYRRLAAERWPESGVAWHNLAADLGDLGHAEEALAAVQRAFRTGLDADATWLVKARAHWTLRQSDSALQAYAQVLTRAPAHTEAAVEMSQVLWMATGDPDRASAHLEAVIAAGGERTRLIHTRAKLFEAAGQPQQVRDVLYGAVAQHPDNVGLLLLATDAATANDEAGRAVAWAERALSLDAGDPQPHLRAAAAYLLAGRAADGLQAARRAAELAPLSQDTWGWVATAARAAGDPQGASLYDYAAFVRPYTLRPPAPWTSLEAWLADLAQALDTLHDGVTHPFDQSLRHGTQTFGELSRQDHPAIRGFFQAIAEPIGQYMREIGTGADPLRVRNTGRYHLAGSWSVRLASSGYHTDHFHPEGWLSSAFYVRVPERAMERGREGWIRFGRPPSPTRPPLEAEHHVRPEPGRLVLFPSYMWHGTEPFEDPTTRLTIAFDVVPA